MIDFSLSRLQPPASAVYDAMGMKSGNRPSPRTADLLQQALELFQTRSEPLGLSAAVGHDEFAAIFAGQGRNAPSTPLQKIFPLADCLHLFAFTLGARISMEIKRLFTGADFALGAVLDAVASLAADQAGRVAEEWLASQVAGKEDSESPTAFLYSPGYCGWHISGQEKLFARLDPGKIGISLNASFLMSPMKSISGVLVAGPAAIHHISEVYPFCGQCKSPTCRERGMARSA